MYHHEEELAPRGQTRVISILTLENAIAAFIGLIIGSRILAAVNIPYMSLIGIIFLLICSAIGVALTFRWTGLSLLDYVFLFVRAQTSRWMKTNIIIPQGHTRTQTQDIGRAAVTRDGKIIGQKLDDLTD